ncbi:DUF4247 domain-containing protein [Oceanobacillus halophilus]|uniref:DUF4247 domain-containing protein n=1 Tax=Oceanobacillus halophilus TaxID=930130 RepID=A0A494ZUA6_9BACI|nr:DUF4247 domain-containing protein [Oceanobacillus halophilus]RKQ29879.1 DUF4247 domain-containing protein [Oceanobacillus halophilus]
MPKKWMLFIGLIFMILLLTACSSPIDRGIQQESAVTAADIPNEPSQNDIKNAISNSPSNQVDAIIAANFPLIDTVTEDGTSAQIYATTQFGLSELSSVLTSNVQPDEKSEVIDDQQVFIYPDYFVTLKPSEADEDVLLIEVASETFVERNYSPSFLQTYFTIRMLDSLFGNNWTNRRTQACLTGDCYGGYSGGSAKSSKKSIFGTPGRGSSSFRGGGTGFGK